MLEESRRAHAFHREDVERPVREVGLRKERGGWRRLMPASGAQIGMAARISKQ